MSTTSRGTETDPQPAKPRQPDPLKHAREQAEAGHFGYALECFMNADKTAHNLHQLDALLRQSV